MVQYAVRRTKASEAGRWVICLQSNPYVVLSRYPFRTKWGATRTAKRWLKENKQSQKLYPVE